MHTRTAPITSLRLICSLDPNGNSLKWPPSLPRIHLLVVKMVCISYGFSGGLVCPQPRISCLTPCRELSFSPLPVKTGKVRGHKKQGMGIVAEIGGREACRLVVFLIAILRAQQCQNSRMCSSLKMIYFEKALLCLSGFQNEVEKFAQSLLNFSIYFHEIQIQT